MSIERIGGKPHPAGPRFIPGVYNYCDRWCERCRFVTRCVIGGLHMGREEEEAPDPDDGIARPWLEEVFNHRLSEEELREIDRQERECDRLKESDPLALDARVKFRPKGASRCRVIGGQFVRSADGL